MARRHKLSRRASRRSVNRGSKIHRKNFARGMRGGIRA